MNKDDVFLLERNNGDTKKYKIIHPFDGRVIPLEPKILRAEAQNLTNKLTLKDVNYILGFAEGGLLSAYAVAEVTNLPFIGSYRVRLKTEHEIHFTEPHSARADHYIYGLRSGDKVVIIEDEITTGSTLLSALESLEKSNITVVDIGAFILAGNFDLSLISSRGYNIKNLYTKQLL